MADEIDNLLTSLLNAFALEVRGAHMGLGTKVREQAARTAVEERIAHLIAKAQAEGEERYVERHGSCPHRKARKEAEDTVVRLRTVLGECAEACWKAGGSYGDLATYGIPYAIERLAQEKADAVAAAEARDKALRLVGVHRCDECGNYTSALPDEASGIILCRKPPCPSAASARGGRT